MINPENKKASSEAFIDSYKKLNSHLIVCFIGTPLVECRRRIETKRNIPIKALPKSCGLGMWRQGATTRPTELAKILKLSGKIKTKITLPAFLCIIEVSVP